jgi:ferredoxin
MPEHEISFGPSALKPPVRRPAGKLLCDVLEPRDSPVVFGCRNGVCGTCLAEVSAAAGTLAPPDADERDVLDMLCPDRPAARLACRVRLSADLLVVPIKLSV